MTLPTSYVIKPYRHEIFNWTFDTPKNKYPHLPIRTASDNMLVAGADSVLDQIAFQFKDFSLRFGLEMETGEKIKHTITLEWQNEDSQGWNNYITSYGLRVGLCPVLKDFYPNPPKVLYIQVIA